MNEALELTYRGQFEEAMEKLGRISRASPFAEWRLFIRGLHAYKGQESEARENWLRLSPDRRPARIANVLMVAESYPPLSQDRPAPTEFLLQHAKTLRLRESVIAEAQAIAKVTHRDPNIAFTFSQVAMLSKWMSNRKLDPDFVLTVGQTCVRLAMYQEDSEVFERLTKLVPGPAHDPRWNLSRILYAVMQNLSDTGNHRSQPRNPFVFLIYVYKRRDGL